MPKIVAKSDTDVVSDFYKKGFREPKTPEEQEPTMPSDLSSLKAINLGDIMNKYCAWREYTESLSNEANVVYAIAQENYDYKYAKKFAEISQGNEKTAITKLDKLLEADETLHSIYVDVYNKRMYKDMLAKKIESYTNCITVISREITRRGQSLERD